jgi:hypothetical protein
LKEQSCYYYYYCRLQNQGAGVVCADSRFFLYGCFSGVLEAGGKRVYAEAHGKFSAQDFCLILALFMLNIGVCLLNSKAEADL